MFKGFTRVFAAVGLYVLQFSSITAAQELSDFQVALNGSNTLATNPIDIGSPFATMDLTYRLSSGQQLSNVRVFKEHECSLASPYVDISWCNEHGCRIGGVADFDSSFESQQDFYHVFDVAPRELRLSVELNVKDSFGAIVSACRNITLRLSPCDAVLETQTREAGDDKNVRMEFVDSETLQPINDVEVLVSSGPVPLLSRPEPGVIIMHTVPKKDKFKFSFSRGLNHRFVSGPYAGQMTEHGLKKIKVALCTQR